MGPSGPGEDLAKTSSVPVQVHHCTSTLCSWQFGISSNDRDSAVDGTSALHAARWPSIQDDGNLA